MLMLCQIVSLQDVDDEEADDEEEDEGDEKEEKEKKDDPDYNPGEDLGEDEPPKKRTRSEQKGE